MRAFLRSSALSCVMLSLALSSTVTWVTPAAAETESAPAPDKASNFLHCDGKPNKESSLGIAARLIAISLVVGLLIPMPEEPDATKRLKGQDGIKACDAALNGDEKAKDGGRRLELIMGRAIHRMEIADWHGAIDDLHSLPVDQPQLTSTRAYRQSLGHTADYLEAIALLAKGDQKGAIAMGYRIGNESPYDPYALQLSMMLVTLDDGYSAEKKQILDQVTRTNPKQISSRALARGLVGDFSGAADDYSAWGDMLAAEDGHPYLYRDLAAIGYRLAGKPEQADALAGAARQQAETDIAEGKHTNLAAGYRELEDFYAIVVALDAGQAMRARNMFSARSHWSTIPHCYVAELARRLQSVGTPEEQANSPIRTPQEINDEFRKSMIANITSKGDKDDRYWSYFIPANSDPAFGKFSENVWNAKNSRYIGKAAVKNPNGKDLNARFIDTSINGSGVPCAYALYLHLAVVAKSQGKSGFMILTGQKGYCSAYFRIGNPDDKDMLPPFMMNADQVISDLKTYIPNPEDSAKN
jgi:hypothetical protein